MLIKWNKDIFCWVFSSVSLKLAIEWKQNCKKGKSKSSIVYTAKRRRHGCSSKSEALFGMKNVGVCKFWKFLSFHNKLETVDLCCSPPPTSVSLLLYCHLFPLCTQLGDFLPCIVLERW